MNIQRQTSVISNFSYIEVFTQVPWTSIYPSFTVLHFEDLGDTSVISECSLGVNLVIDNFFNVAADSSPLYKI